jgi:glycosyltransferase involved in cell wall biosynthesis
MKKIGYKKHEPVISVLMTIYKDRDYLAEAIESILNQLYKNWELLILAEPETPEESLNIIRSFHDARIRLIINEKHLGFSRSLNKGIKLAKGKFIARMDADDISRPDRLIIQYLYMLLHVKTAICGSNVTFIDKTGKTLGKSDLPLRSKEIAVMLHFEDVIYHPSVMFRKSVFVKNKYYYKTQSAEDYELWTRVCLKDSIANISATLLERRVHGKNAVFEHKTEIYECDLITQKHLWESKRIEFLLDRPWYDKKSINRKEKEKRIKMINDLDKKTTCFINKRRLFKKLINVWAG